MNDAEQPEVTIINVSDEALERLNVFARAQTGEFEPFAKFIEDGMALDPEMRLWLAAFLRGELKWKPGNRRTIGQMMADQRVLLDVKILMCELGVNQSRAIEILLDRNPEMNFETVKKQLVRANRELNVENKIRPSYK